MKPLSSHTHENPLGFYIRNIAHTLRYRIEEELSHYSISSAQGRLLGIMAHSSDFPCGINRKFLEKTMHIKGPSVTNLLNGLEKKSFIERNISKEDGRALDIAVTEKGMELVNKINRIFAEYEGQLTSQMTEEDISVFRRLLEKAYENISL
ncbi:MAG: MarR family transcriptional regulator [Saccharofermentanales bacterium]